MHYVDRWHLLLSKKDNVKDIFLYDNPDVIMAEKVLLIDDFFDSGYTIKEIGKYLTKIGAEVIAPLVIAKTVGGGHLKMQTNNGKFQQKCLLDFYCTFTLNGI